MARTNTTTAVDQVDATHPSVLWSYEIIVPPDAAVHDLSEIGFGYYPVGTPAASDRDVRSITIHNRTDQFPAGVSIFVGSPDTTLLLPFEIVPGGYFTHVIDKLGTLAIANYSLLPVTAVISLMTTTP